MKLKGLLKSKKVIAAALALLSAVVAYITGWEGAAEVLNTILAAFSSPPVPAP